MLDIGRYDSNDGRVSMSWALPDWSALDHKLCSLGVHIASRKIVVTGYVGYFSSVKRAYCACGRKCWIWYEGGWAGEDTTEPGGHLHWIEGQIESQRRMSLHHEWERAMMDQHPCWGERGNCISCGCSAERPCVSHVGRPAPFIDKERMTAASIREDELRAQMWPK